MWLPGIGEGGDHGRGTLYRDALHIVPDAADTAHFFAAAGAAGAAMDQQGQRAAMAGAFFCAFVVEDKDAAMPGSGAQDIAAGDIRVCGDDGAAKGTLAFFGQARWLPPRCYRA